MPLTCQDICVNPLVRSDGSNSWGASLRINKSPLLTPQYMSDDDRCAVTTLIRYFVHFAHSFSLSPCFTQPIIFAWMINPHCLLLTWPDKPDECSSAAVAKTTTCQQSIELPKEKFFSIFSDFQFLSGLLVSRGPSLSFSVPERSNPIKAICNQSTYMDGATLMCAWANSSIGWMSPHQ